MGAASCKSSRNTTVTPNITPVSSNKKYQEMANKGFLFMLEFTIGYHGHSQADLLEVWTQEIQEVLESKKNGTVLQAWKVVGERKAYVVYQAESCDSMDKISFDSPIMKKLGDQVTIKSSLLRPYYSWYKELKERLSDDSEVLEDLPSKFDPENAKANYYLVTMDIGYEGLKQEELLKIWYQEALRAVKAKNLGHVVDIFKVTAERLVHIIFNLPNAGALDKLMLNVPLSKEIGDRVKTDIKVVIPYEQFLSMLQG
ncbi:hypothetical protein TrispH2_004048 [Trichoplax sp. H2]|nr:hypothetical protein TrispH2_004048 [Trichoplax sp. H2]|eukprot:RDD42994.1 hypothetical protein TrispH2_004048 [Trichoplax sp. H2]